MDSVLFLVQKYQKEDEVTQYVDEISSFLLQNDIDPHIVCFGEEGYDKEENGVHIHKVPFELHGDNFFSWTMLLQSDFVRKIRELTEEYDISIIHANNWVTVPATVVASKILGLPFVITFHSIERERGMNEKHSPHINDLEEEGARKSSYVIIHEENTGEALEGFDLPEGKVKFLGDSEWNSELMDIYKQVVKVSGKNIERNDNNEHIDAYMGVPSS